MKQFSLLYPEISRVSFSIEDRGLYAWNHWLAGSRGPRTPAGPQVVTTCGVFVWRGLCPYEEETVERGGALSHKVVKRHSLARVEDPGVPSLTSNRTMPLDPRVVCPTLRPNGIRFQLDSVLSFERTRNGSIGCLCMVKSSRTTYSVSNHIHPRHENNFSVQTRNELRNDPDDGIEKSL